MEFKKPYEQPLLQGGYTSLSNENKNLLVSDIANNFGITFSEVTDRMILDVHIQLKLAEVNEAYHMELGSGYIHLPTDHMYDITLNKQVDFIGTRVLLQTTNQPEVFWLTEDIGVVSHTPEEFIEVFEGVISYKGALDTKLIKINESIMLSADGDGVISYDWWTYVPTTSKGDAE